MRAFVNVLLLVTAVISTAAHGQCLPQQWAQTGGAAPPARVGISHAMVFDEARGVTIMFGGHPGVPSTYYGDMWQCDHGVWTQLTPPLLPSARENHAMAYDSARGRIVLFGGAATNATTLLCEHDTWEWDGTQWWLLAVTGPSGRSNHALAYDAARQRTVMYGGFGGIASPGALTDTWEWDGISWTQVVTPTPGPHVEFAMDYHPPTGKTVLHGGT